MPKNSKRKYFYRTTQDFESSDVQKIELTAHKREVRHG